MITERSEYFRGTVTITVTRRGKPEGSAMLIFASSEMTGEAQ
jgi:hypothetical protein